MITPDPKNHSEDYIISLESLDFKELSLDFYIKYEKKLDAFENKINELTEDAYDYTKSPENALHAFAKAYKYLNEKIKPFFIKMQEHYGDDIMEYFEDLENNINSSKRDYLANDYEYHKRDYEMYISEQQHIKALKGNVLKILKENTPIKQVDLLRQFNKNDSNLIKKYIEELCVSGKILKARRTTSGKGTIFLVYIENK